MTVVVPNAKPNDVSVFVLLVYYGEPTKDGYDAYASGMVPTAMSFEKRSCFSDDGVSTTGLQLEYALLWNQRKIDRTDEEDLKHNGR
jgi:hypothetical protein